jgi:hypothetical protein
MIQPFPMNYRSNQGARKAFDLERRNCLDQTQNLIRLHDLGEVVLAFGEHPFEMLNFFLAEGA